MPLKPDSVPSKPELNEHDAARIAQACYGIEAAATRADGYADQTFLLQQNDAPAYVLKVSAAGGNESVTELQNAMLDHLAGRRMPLGVPRVLPDTAGRKLSVFTSKQGQTRKVRMLTFLSGDFAADLEPADAALLRSIGRGLGALDAALLDFSHPAASRLHKWHVLNAQAVCENAPLDDDTTLLVSRCLDDYAQRVQPKLAGLRTSVIHADANDHNLLVAERPGLGLRASGLIDFGDAALAPTVFEVAIALAYFMMRQARPVLAAQELLAGYHRALPLLDEELALLYDLVRVRLCMTLCHAARARQSAPGNAYLLRSEADARRLLSALHDVQRLFFTASMRDTCGLPPWPKGKRLSHWIAAQSPCPLFESLAKEQPRLLDFTPLSDDLDGAIAPRNLDEFEALIERLLRASGTGVGIGRYAEIRGLYQSRVFTSNEDEARTVHLGVDVFAPAGTAINAPFAGAVHSFADNARPLDYGPTIILEHDLPGSPAKFYTLYGHLARRSLDGLEVGKQVGQGEPVGYIGESAVNGGWPAHLHFQVMLDLLGCRGDFPGVARHSEIGVWKSLCPNPAQFVGLVEGALDADCGLSPIELARRRDLCLSPSLSLSFDSPVKVVRGSGANLFTEQGRKILDLVNNVAHVGHAHPHVATAVARQEARLNTNTRYLHDGLVTYAERLTALLPAELDTCFLVCTGSEANELALRLARAFTGGTDVVVVDGAYHGHTSSLIDLSPYKFNGRGGAGRPSHVRVASMPDPYNGEHAGKADAGPLYAASVAAACAGIADQERQVAAYFCESAMGCGGQIILPPGYLHAAYAHARQAGAVCVADEVQVGFGRLGRYLWAFEHQAVVPDILTLGKPMGNGYPLAAVVTRREIAEAFANGMEYFNTFGGNPVACAAGHAVLDVIEEQGLVRHAQDLGSRWLAALRGLRDRHALIGDVRGSGLFIGIELVRDRHTREADAAAAHAVVEALKARDIQVSIDGPRYNVLKIKPPMVISGQDAARVTSALDDVLGTIATRAAKRR